MVQQHRNSVVEVDEHLVGSEVFIKRNGDPYKVYEKGKVVAHDKGKLTIAIGKDVEVVPIDQCRNSNMGIRAIDMHELTKIHHINEAAVMQIIKDRYFDDVIYTYARPLLVVVNPFKAIDTYSDKKIMEYREADFIDDLPPHIFAVAQRAWSQLQFNQENQSCVISGESGAGKTETTKHLMKFFATTAASRNGRSSISGSNRVGDDKVQRALMGANPLLESFGNAKTERNDNSSRFGRFIKLRVKDGGGIIAGEVSNFLLEKSRVVLQGSRERCYHIFYQILEGLTDAEKMKIGLRAGPKNYKYLMHGCTDIDNVDDKVELLEVKQSLSALGFSEVETLDVFRVLSAILMTGEIEFKNEERSGSDSAATITTKHEFREMCRLLGVDENQTEKCLTTISRDTIDGIIVTPVNSETASMTTSSLGKALYDELFNWLVTRVNAVVAPSEVAVSPDGKEAPWIGILDIFGFEFFQVNSFEQFLINFANEKLQQFFVQCVFKAEVAEYEKEEIDYSMIVYQDNQVILDLIEGPQQSLLGLIEEQCLITNGNPQAMVGTARTTHRKCPYLAQPKGDARTRFIVKHSAAAVEYEAELFLLKNKDKLGAGLTTLLKTASCSDDSHSTKGKSIIANVFEHVEVLDPKKMKGKFIGSQFQRSMSSLLDRLRSSSAHFVRCLKPNSNKRAHDFNEEMVISQLHCLSILEAIALQHAGFAYRSSFEGCLRDYELLVLGGMVGDLSNPRDACKRLMENVGLAKDEFQVGKTKIFVRKSGLKALDIAKREILNRVKPLAVSLQACARGQIARDAFFGSRERIIRVQSLYRRYLMQKDTIAVKRLHRCMIGITGLLRFATSHRRMADSAISIQTAIRTSLARRWFFWAVKQELRKRGANDLIRVWKQYSATSYMLALQRKKNCDIACGYIATYVRTMQSVDGFIRYRLEQDVRKAAEVIQRYWRGFQHRRRLQLLLKLRSLLWPLARFQEKRVEAATKIQALARGYFQRKQSFAGVLRNQLAKIRQRKQNEDAVEVVQAAIRRYLACKRFNHLEAAALIMQRRLHSRMSRHTFLLKRMACLQIQRWWRSRVAHDAILIAKVGALTGAERSYVKRLEAKERQVLHAFHRAISAGRLEARGQLIASVSLVSDISTPYKHGWSAVVRHMHHLGSEVCKVAAGEHHTIIVVKAKAQMNSTDGDDSNNQASSANPNQGNNVNRTFTLIYGAGDNFMGRLGTAPERPHTPLPIGPLLFPLSPERFNVSQVVCGTAHTLLSTSQGLLFAWGSNNRGQCGNVSVGVRAVNRPSHVKVLPTSHLDITRSKSSSAMQALGGTIPGYEIVSISAGPEHSACVTSAGRVFVWGNKEHIGLNTVIQDLYKPTQAFDGIQATEVLCGYGTNLVLTSKGNVFSFGSSKLGLLGLGYSTEDSPIVKATTPQMLPAFEAPDVVIVRLALGREVAAAITDRGVVYVWGAISAPSITTGSKLKAACEQVDARIKNLLASSSVGSPSHLKKSLSSSFNREVDPLIQETLKIALATGLASDPCEKTPVFVPTVVDLGILAPLNVQATHSASVKQKRFADHAIITKSQNQMNVNLQGPTGSKALRQQNQNLLMNGLKNKGTLGSSPNSLFSDLNNGLGTKQASLAASAAVGGANSNGMGAVVNGIIFHPSSLCSSVACGWNKVYLRTITGEIIGFDGADFLLEGEVIRPAVYTVCTGAGALTAATTQLSEVVSVSNSSMDSLFVH